MLNYPVGGLDYIALRANYVWQRIARWLDAGAPYNPPKKFNSSIGDNQDDRTNHKVFQSMKKFVSKSERIKEFVEYIESNGHRVEDLFDFVDSHNVENGIHFKGTLVRKGKKVVYIYRNTIISYEMAKHYAIFYSL